MSGSEFQWLVGQYLSTQTHDLEVAVPGDPGNPSTLAVFPAHALVLRSQSSVLSGMLDKAQAPPGKVKRITFKHRYNPRSVEYFLRFLYIKDISKKIPFPNLMELLHMADVYDVDDLLTECEQRIMGSLSVDTVCELYEVSAHRSLTGLQEACRVFIRNHKQVILANDLHFSLLTESNLMKVFSETNAKEFDWNRKTKDGEVQRKAMLRYSLWLSCCKGFNAAGAFLKTLDLKKAEKEQSPFTTDPDPENWIPDLYMDIAFSDMEVVVEGGRAKFPAHSLVLNRQSEVFLSMWSEIRNSCDLNKVLVLPIEMKGVNARVAEHMLRYLYTHFIPSEISDSNLMELLNVSHRFEIKDLQAKCAAMISKRVNLLNCCQVYELAERLDTRPLAFVSLHKIQDNVQKVLKNNLHFSLSKESLVRVLSNTKTGGLVKEWSKWRCCLLGVEPNDTNLAEMIETMLAESAAKAQHRRSEEVVSRSPSLRFLTKRKSDPASSPKDGVPCPKDSVPCPKDSVPCPKDGVPCPKDGVPCPKNSVPCPKDTVVVKNGEDNSAGKDGVK